MKKYFYTLIVVLVFSFAFQACVSQQLEVNADSDKKVASESAVPKAPIPKLAEGPEAQKPDWKIGYQWEYEWESPDYSGAFTMRIVREETFDGIPCFVMKHGRNELFYTKDVLGWLAAKRKRRGIVLSKMSQASWQALAWPLKVGRQWKIEGKFERPQEETTIDIDSKVVVTGFEEVTVPAGKFKAFKIEITNFRSGDLQYEYWYSPKVKWFVKRIRYIGRGSLPRERRLKSYTPQFGKPADPAYRWASGNWIGQSQVGKLVEIDIQVINGNQLTGNVIYHGSRRIFEGAITSGVVGKEKEADFVKGQIYWYSWDITSNFRLDLKNGTLIGMLFKIGEMSTPRGIPVAQRFARLKKVK